MGEWVNLRRHAMNDSHETRGNAARLSDQVYTPTSKKCAEQRKNSESFLRASNRNDLIILCVLRGPALTHLPAE